MSAFATQSGDKYCYRNGEPSACALSLAAIFVTLTSFVHTFNKLQDRRIPTLWTRTGIGSSVLNGVYYPVHFRWHSVLARRAAHTNLTARQLFNVI